jgi:hypothetical protein
MVVSLLSACGSAAVRPLPVPTAAPVHDQVIVPGERIGPIAIGMKGATLLDAMGAPDSTDRMKNAGIENYAAAGLEATVMDDSQQVISITTDSAQYATAEGVHIGSSDFEVRSRMGAPTTSVTNDLGVEALCYERGVTFFVTISGNATVPAGAVYTIQVHPASATEGPLSHC